MKLEKEIIDIDGLKVEKIKVVNEPIKKDNIEPSESKSFTREEFKNGNAN